VPPHGCDYYSISACRQDVIFCGCQTRRGGPGFAASLRHAAQDCILTLRAAMMLRGLKRHAWLGGSRRRALGRPSAATSLDSVNCIPVTWHSAHQPIFEDLEFKTLRCQRRSRPPSPWGLVDAPSNCTHKSWHPMVIDCKSWRGESPM
jgi:hypothetical protein